MKNITIKQLITAIAFSTIAANAFAAPTNPPMPKCPRGQIPVLTGGDWVCKEASIKAPTTGQAASRTTSPTIKVAPTARPIPAKPDLSIANILKLDSNVQNVSSFKAYVKNTTNVASKNNHMSITSSKGNFEMAVPAIAANSGQWVLVQTFEFKAGERILLAVDSKSEVAETNESNNKYAFNW